MTSVRRSAYEQEEVLIDRRVIASYPTYLEAHEVVDDLVSQGIPRWRLTIVAEELRLLEDIAAGSGAMRASAHGLLAGSATGLFFGLFFGLFSWVDPLVSAAALALYGLLFGAVVGALLGLAAHRLSRNDTHPIGVGRLQAGRYAVLATDDVAERSVRLVRTIHRPRLLR
jgi:hypothetical protein